CRQEANGARKRRGRSTLSATARARVDRDARSRSTRVHLRSNRTWRERCERRSSALVGDASAAFGARASKAIDRACLHVKSSQIPTRFPPRVSVACFAATAVTKEAIHRLGLVTQGMILVDRQCISRP